MTVDRVDQRIALRLHGDLDIAAAPQVEAELRNVEAMQPRELVLDLRNLSFMDSTGLRLLVTADLRARAQDRSVTIVRGAPAVQRLFKVTGLEGRLHFIDDTAP